MQPVDERANENPIEREAAAWFARRRSGEMTADEAEALEAWLDADPRHRLTFEAAEAIWGGLGLTRDAPEVLAMRAQARRRPPQVRRRGFIGRMAAGLVAAACLGAGVWATSDIGPFVSRDFPNQTFTTELGQRSTVKLPDGSTVTLNTDTVLRTVASDQQRLIYLERGQAFFRVAKDKEHPFVVHAAGRTVTAIGTAFDVRADPLKFEVTLVEGKVKVETPLPRSSPVAAVADAVLTARTQATELVPGTQFVATADDERWSVRRANAANETAWVTGWLQFDRAPLAEAAEELSRYSSRKIVLEDAALGAMPVSGRFQAGDLESFIAAVAVYGIKPAPSADQAQIRLYQERG